MGALELAFRQLREKLAREGLFDPARKRPLPPFVRQIAVVTSPTGAAIRDFLQVLGRRWRGADVLIAPVRVQGEGAAEEIAAAIEMLNRLARPIDCLVVTRGGGSLEDLWAFNEEIVVRAIAASRIPVISAVGHEIDVTLSDLAADVRALTPSEAAELVAPAAEELFAELRQIQKRMTAALRSRALTARSHLDAIQRHHAFRRPFQLIYDLTRQVDELSARGAPLDPPPAATRPATNRDLRLSLGIAQSLGRAGPGLQHNRTSADGRVIRAAGELSPGEQISTRFARGQAISRVEKVEE